jgi:glycosyltransferase involved in cell wall biosynthesis
MPFFSVIIPLYNKEKFVENAVNSILKQTFSDFEIIIVEDCSTDKSWDVVSKIASDKIKIVQHEKNKGLSASRNSGIKIANANYLTFLDADDVWKPNYLAKIHALIQQFPEAKLLATNYEELYPNNVVVLPKNNSSNIEKDGIINDFFQTSLAQPLYCSCSLCVEKSVFVTIGYFDEKITFAEDIDFNIRANNRFKLAYSKEALVTYTMLSENQITTTNLKNKVIPNFDSHETLAAKNHSLKKYLDFNRYVFAKHFKMEKDTVNFYKMKSGIDPKNLNFKQRLLLKSPLLLLQIIKKIKRFFIGKGIQITSYDSFSKN